MVVAAISDAHSALKAGFIDGHRGRDRRHRHCDATSPLMYFATIDRKTDGGVNITASHNPVEYNGIKMVEREPCRSPRRRFARCATWISGDFEHVVAQLRPGRRPAYYDKIASLVSLPGRSRWC